MGWTIKQLYSKVDVRLEYPFKLGDDDKDAHIDIMVIYNDNGKTKGIPIELKYKTKACTVKIDGVPHTLKNQSAKNPSSYLYLKDIERIESLRNKLSEKGIEFKKGFTIFLTNDSGYNPKSSTTDREKYNYYKFSLADGEKKLVNWIGKTIMLLQNNTKNQ